MTHALKHVFLAHPKELVLLLGFFLRRVEFENRLVFFVILSGLVTTNKLLELLNSKRGVTTRESLLLEHLLDFLL